MKVIYNQFLDNTNTVDHFIINYTRDSINSFEQTKEVFGAVNHDVEIKIELDSIELINSKNNESLIEGAWISFNGETYILRIYFYLSKEDKNNLIQQEIKSIITENDFDKIENFFLMEERCLIG